MSLLPLSRSRRSGYTLLEVTLATAIGVILLGALYSTLSLHLDQANAGRDLVARSHVARALFNQMNSEIIVSMNMTDGSRARVAAATSAAATAAASSSSSATATTGTSGTTGTSSATTTDPTATTNAIILPFGIQGDNQSISLFMPKFPKEAWPQNVNDIPLPFGDVRAISYWYVDGKGLYRQEVKPILDPNSLALLPPNGAPPVDDSFLISPEVQGITFSYYDGTEWQDTWDGTVLGADGVTPIGPPQAIQITLLLAPPAPADGSPADPTPLSYKHVIAVGTANGTTIFTPPTTPSTSGSGM